MKIAVGTILALVLLLVVVGCVAYLVGRTLPVDHVAAVQGVVAAPPEKVFALITDVGAGPTWRPEVKSVDVLPRENGQDHWIEHLGHGTDMNFHAILTQPVDASGHGRREVELKDPQYGGVWTYEISPGPSAAQTTVKITETGYINPPIYRFVMVHVFGMTKNLDTYLRELQTQAGKS